MGSNFFLMDGILFPQELTVHIPIGLSAIGLALIKYVSASGSLFSALALASFMLLNSAIVAAALFPSSLAVSV